MTQSYVVAIGCAVQWGSTVELIAYHLMELWVVRPETSGVYMFSKMYILINDLLNG